MEFALESTDAAIWTRDIETDEMEIHPTVCPVFGTTIESLDVWLKQIHPQDGTEPKRSFDRQPRRMNRTRSSFGYLVRRGRDGVR